MFNVMSFLRTLGIAAVFSGSVFANAQSVLTLDEALASAKSRNGLIRAAFLDVQSAKSRVRQSLGTFLPEITPVARYDYRRVGTEGLISTFDDDTTEIGVSWRILDSGQRQLGYRSAKLFEARQTSASIQTLRNILFSVNQQYFNALRAQELMKVRDASVERAEEIKKATQAQIEAKVAPAKDILQAQADALNARVDQLDARNQYTTSLALLKASIGAEPTAPIELAVIEPPKGMEPLPPLADVMQAGLAAREDLRATRSAIEGQKLTVRSAEINSGISWTLDANYARQFTSQEQDTRNVTFLASIPLFDGNRSREAVNEAKFDLEALRATYSQDERDALAEIESAYRTLAQDRERLDAATAAIEAARENYNAATEAQKLGAEGTNIITVLTAKISLVTAESNYVNAVYDVYVSEARLKLVTGQPVRGEIS